MLIPDQPISVRQTTMPKMCIMSADEIAFVIAKHLSESAGKLQLDQDKLDASVREVKVSELQRPFA